MNKVTDKKKILYRKNEIVSRCTACDCERILAYWDDELEHYIYLSDEPVLCTACKIESECPASISKQSNVQPVSA